MTKARIGIYGLGTMGSALALNMAEKGFEVAVTNREVSWIADFCKEAEDFKGNMHAYENLEDFVAGLAKPRAIWFMIPSGKPLDDMIETITPMLDAGDMIIDGGNADFNATRRREAALKKKGLNFLGIGVSGGEEGARHGPSIMAGGPADSHGVIADILEAVAAKFQGDPCAALCGPDGAGHFVKTVHNGIEYADMQMIADIWGILRDGRGWTPAQAGALFTRWNRGPLESYLIEISGKALAATDPDTGQPMVDMILDQAGQKGTGRWTLIEALKLGQSASTIEAAVAARSWSSMKDTRADVAQALDVPGSADLPDDATLETALLTAKITAYAQGLSLLAAASGEFGWSLDLARIAEIWRAGCIIRSAMLDDIASAVRDGLPSGTLILAPAFRDTVAAGLPALRQTVAAAAQAGLPVPALSGALTYLETLRRARGTADLIQAQRDFFGAHGFQRIDREGTGFHGPWGAS